MKKLLLLTSAVMLAVTGYGQGTVQSANGTTSLLTNGITSAALVLGSTFKVALYYLPDQVETPTPRDFDERGVLLGSPVNIAPAAGRYSTGTRSTPATTAPGGQAWFQVRAWESAFGADYMSALNNGTAIGGRLALVGTSAILRVTTGNPTTIPAGNPTAIAVPGFILTPVPEPAAIGLGLIGVGALLLLRRRK